MTMRLSVAEKDYYDPNDATWTKEDDAETLMVAIFPRLYPYNMWGNYFDCKNNIDQVLLVLWGYNDLLGPVPGSFLGQTISLQKAE